MNISNIFENIIKKLKKEKSLEKSIKISDKTNVTGDNSPFDSVAFVQLTSYIEFELTKKLKKNFSILLNEIPEIKKNKSLTIGGLKKYISSKIKR